MSANLVQAKLATWVFCEQQQIWVIETEQGALPIITEQTLLQLKTKNCADGGEDGDCQLALELTTQTYQQIESDDDTCPNSLNNLPQLAAVVVKPAYPTANLHNHLIAQDFLKNKLRQNELSCYDSRRLGRCRSGRTGRIRNPLCQQWHLGFKSLSSRHISSLSP